MNVKIFKTPPYKVENSIGVNYIARLIDYDLSIHVMVRDEEVVQVVILNIDDSMSPIPENYLTEMDNVPDYIIRWIKYGITRALLNLKKNIIAIKDNKVKSMY